MIVGMMAAAIFDFGGGFGVRDGMLALAGAYVVANYNRFTLQREEVWVLFTLFLLIPLWSVVNGLLHGGNLAVARPQVTPFVFGILFFVLLSQGGSQYALHVFYTSITILAGGSSAAILYGVLFPDTPLIEAFTRALETENEIHGKFGVRPLAGRKFYAIYFKATLFYVAGFIYALYRNDLWRTLLFFLALVLSISKAGIALCVVFFLWYVVTASSGKQRGVVLFGVILTGILTYQFVDLEFITGYLDYMVLTFKGEATTTKVRIGHWQSLVDLMQEHPLYLIYGQGTGTQFASLGEAARHGFVQSVYNIELDHADSIRQFGLLWFLAFSALVGYVVTTLIRSAASTRKGLGYALAGLFIAAGTNPVLITPLFMIVLAAYVQYVQGRV